jgi:proteasome accessory factor C
MLAVVPWIASQPDGATAVEIAAQFGVTEGRVEKDLQLIAEVEPVAQANVLMWEEHGRWYVDRFTKLSRPLRLTKADAFAVVAAAQLMLQAPGVGTSGAFASAIGKVARAVGGDVQGLEVQLPRPPALGVLHDALEQRRCVQMDYYSAGRDQVTTRVVEPLALFTVDGWWHLVGWCRTAQAERDFRVDRVRHVELLDDTFEWRAPTLRTDVAFDPDAADATPIRIQVQPAQRWAVERYPVRDVVDNEDGTTQFTVDAAGDAWLERLLLRLGPTAKVIEPTDCTVGVDAAQRLLTLYDEEL